MTMLRRYTKDDIIAAWRRRRGLAQGWLSDEEAALAEGLDRMAFEEIDANYAHLLATAPARHLPQQTMLNPRAEKDACGGLRIELPDTVARLLEARTDGGATICRFVDSGEALPPERVCELTGDIKAPYGVFCGRNVTFYGLGESRITQLRVIAAPSDGSYTLSPAIYPYLFEHYEEID